MVRTNALFTALNRGEKVKALEICFEDAGEDPDEKKFCCILAERLGITLENAPGTLKDKLSSCSAILGS